MDHFPVSKAVRHNSLPTLLASRGKTESVRQGEIEPSKRFGVGVVMCQIIGSYLFFLLGKLIQVIVLRVVSCHLHESGCSAVWRLIVVGSLGSDSSSWSQRMPHRLLVFGSSLRLLSVSEFGCLMLREGSEFYQQENIWKHTILLVLVVWIWSWTITSEYSLSSLLKCDIFR